MAKLESLSDYPGDTWIIDIIQATLGGQPADLTDCTITGTIAGISVSSFLLAPEPGVDARVIVDSSATELAIPSTSPVLSEIVIDFADGTRKRKTFNFTVKSVAS